MKYLGIDFGIKRVGLAVSDETGKMVFPLKTIHRSTRENLFLELLNIVEQKGIEAIVLGLPLRPDGEKSLTCRQAENFMHSLGRRTSLPIYTVNEAYTSLEAEDILSRQDVKGERQKESLDQAAAMIILESFLECIPYERGLK
ncbi:Holliday junction resolvase RuvX [Desulfonatronospira sp.]|uniref:Holliday junction resolvase RuvX n=1 Tax=Desulfonatronospira sp. TaxID=1962951 RepID=UPI0025BDEEFF|nr:Holliday junction resolvase RuvX [Desulfonatronospira sp.]